MYILDYRVLEKDNNHDPCTFEGQNVTVSYN